MLEVSVKHNTNEHNGRTYVRVTISIPPREEGQRGFSLHVDPRDITPQFIKDLELAAMDARVQQEEIIERAKHERWAREAAAENHGPGDGMAHTGKTARNRLKKKDDSKKTNIGNANPGHKKKH